MRPVSKVVVMNDDQEILLLKRQRWSPNDPGGWDLPGGLVDEGETFELAATRETLEETGLEVELGPSLHFWSAKGSWGGRVYGHTFFARSFTKEVTLSYEHTEHVWVSVDQARQMELTPFMRATLLPALDKLGSRERPSELGIG